MRNKERASLLEAKSDMLAYATKSNGLMIKIIRCKDCIYHEPFPDTSHRDKNSVYCSVYDLVKWDDGFCESGTNREEN